MSKSNLSRGKRIDNGKLVEGWYIEIDGVSYILPNGGHIHDIVQIIPSTMGAYTGLNDKSGKRVFVGDRFCPYYVTPFGEVEIGNLDFDNSGIVGFIGGSFCIIYANKSFVNLSMYADWKTGEYVQNSGQLLTMKSNKLNGIVTGNIYN